jgi:ABC-type multidrug transport system ATPase subunit
MSRKTKEYQQFMSKVMLINQTEMVELLLKHNRQALTIHNLEEADVLTIYYGRVREPKMIFKQRQDELNGHHGRTVNSIVNAKSVEDKAYWQERLEEIKADLEKMDKAQWQNRKIYQWLLIPHWYADYLIKESELVISFKCCSWLGIEYHFTKNCTLEDMLLKHFKHFSQKESKD